MRLTPFAKLFITIVILAVVGYAVYFYRGGDIRKWAVGDKPAGKTEQVNANDFDALKNAPADPARNAGATGVTGAALASGGRLTRPLVVAINTWAGHAPGIVFNNGLEPDASSNYRKKFGLDVKFVLIEDPAAKLAAFRNGNVASILSEQNQQAKSIIMQDWSRGGDGIVSLAGITSIEGLKGKKVSCTQFTPSHFLLLYLLAQSGLTPEDRATVEKNIIFTQDAPAAAAMFKAGQVDAAVTWEPDLSAAVAARGDAAHVLVSTTAASNIIADTLVARQDLIEKSPETVRDFVRGWFDGIEMIKNDPAASYALVGKALKLDAETVSGMLSGLKLTPYADNAQFYGLTGGKAHYETLFDTAFV
ncbi:MAG: ABC transporter substrate-binding protein, partial [Acidobacteria bacterium]|nr:ABC transporter substrate-binding protein [Acidobacteriota bacterium]